MRRSIFLVFLLAAPAYGQDRAEAQLAKLPADIQALVRHLPAEQALRMVAYARENLIATGNAHAAPDGLRSKLEMVLAPHSGARSASAGATSFPPLSPLVPAISFEGR